MQQLTGNSPRRPSLFSLERVPETGRWRFMDVSPDAETRMGLQTERETLAQYQGQILPASHPTTRRVREVARRIVEGNGLGRIDHEPGRGDQRKAQGMLSSAMGQGGAGDLFDFGSDSSDSPPVAHGSDTAWQVYVVRDREQTKNAFVLPGGKIFVFEGILPVCANDDGLASVLGHGKLQPSAGAVRIDWLTEIALLPFFRAMRFVAVVGHDVATTRRAVDRLLDRQPPNVAVFLAWLVHSGTSITDFLDFTKPPFRS